MFLLGVRSAWQSTAMTHLAQAHTTPDPVLEAGQKVAGPQHSKTEEKCVRSAATQATLLACPATPYTWAAPAVAGCLALLVELTEAACTMGVSS